MVGRQDELAALIDVAEQVRTGAVRLALVTGEAGIGKSRLVTEFVSGLSDATVLMSHGVAMSSGEIPFGVIGEFLTNLLRDDPDALHNNERHALAPLLPGIDHDKQGHECRYGEVERREDALTFAQTPESAKGC